MTENSDPSPAFLRPATSTMRYWLGSYLALQSAVTISLNLVLARLAYDAGSDPLTVNTARSLFLVVCLYAFLVLSGRSTALPPRPRYASWLLGLVLCAELYGLFAAVAFIPVSLAVLIFYTYPAVTLLISRLTTREPVSVLRVIALAAAFGGLVLAFRVPVGAPDWRGIAWATIAAIGFACVVVGSGRAMRGRDSRVVTFHMILVTTLVMVLASALAWPPAWPAGVGGWLALAGSCVTFAIATLSIFAAVQMIGPVRTAAIDNSSPIWAIGFAILLVGESLSPGQAMGAALVIGAVFAMQFGDRGRPST